MRAALFVEFGNATALKAAIDAVREEKIEIIDAFTPFPIEGLGASLGGRKDGKRIRWWMLIGGLGAAFGAYCLQTYSAMIGYPFSVGGRPDNSWPTFMLFPFEFGVFCAAVFGMLGLFWSTGLPQLNHHLFDVEGFERASNDRFILALDPPEKKRLRARLEERMDALGALIVREVEL